MNPTGGAEAAPKPQVEGQPKGPTGETRVDTRAKGVGGLLRSARSRVSPPRILNGLSKNPEGIATAAAAAQPEAPSLTPGLVPEQKAPQMQFGIKDKAGDYNPILSADQLNNHTVSTPDAPVPPKVVSPEASTVTPASTPDTPVPQIPPEAASQPTSGEIMAQVVQSMSPPENAPKNILQPPTAPAEAAVSPVPAAETPPVTPDAPVPQVASPLSEHSNSEPNQSSPATETPAPYDPVDAFIKRRLPEDYDETINPELRAKDPEAYDLLQKFKKHDAIFKKYPDDTMLFPPELIDYVRAKYNLALDPEKKAFMDRVLAIEKAEAGDTTHTEDQTETPDPQAIAQKVNRVSESISRGLDIVRKAWSTTRQRAYNAYQSRRERSAAQRETAQADAAALQTKNAEAASYFNFFRKAAEQARAETKPITRAPSTPDMTPSTSPASSPAAEGAPSPASKPEAAVADTAPPSSEDPSNNLSEDEIADLAALRTKYEGEIAANKAGNTASSPDSQPPRDNDTPQAVIDTVLSAANASPGSAENKRLTSADYADAMASQLQNYSRGNSLIGKFKSWREARQQARKDKQQQIAKDFFDTAMAAKRAKGEIPPAQTPASATSPEGPADNPYNLQLQHIEDAPLAQSASEQPEKNSSPLPETDAADAVDAAESILAEARRSARTEATSPSNEKTNETPLSAEAQTLFDSLNQSFTQIDAETANLIKEGKVSAVDANIATLRKKREAALTATDGTPLSLINELSGKNDYLAEASEYWDADKKFDEENKAAKTNEEGDALLAKTLQADFAREQRFLNQRINELSKTNPDLASSYTAAQTKELQAIATRYVTAGMLEQSVIERMKGGDPVLDAAIDAKLTADTKAKQDERTNARNAATRNESSSAEKTASATPGSSVEAGTTQPDTTGETTPLPEEEARTLNQHTESIKKALANYSPEVQAQGASLIETMAKEAGINPEDNVEEKAGEETDEKTKKKRKMLLEILKLLPLLAAGIIVSPAVAGAVGGVAAVNAASKVGGGR